MVKELENFLASLEPKWEDTAEFDWLRKKTDIFFQKIKISAD